MGRMNMRSCDFWNLSVYEWFLAFEGWCVEKGYAHGKKKESFVTPKERKRLEDLIEQYG